MYTLVENKKERQAAVAACMKPLEEVAAKLRKKYNMKIAIQTVGSNAVNLITKDSKGTFDLDFDLLITQCPAELRDNPKKLKDLIRGWLDEAIDRMYTRCGKDSTSVLTYIFHEKNNTEMIYSMDVGILTMAGKNQPVLRLIFDKPKQVYIWNQMTERYNQLAASVKLLNKKGKKNELRKRYLEKKNDSKYIERASMQILAEAVNELR